MSDLFLESIAIIAMQCRLSYNLGHIRVLEQRFDHARNLFETLFSEQFRADTRLAHCFGLIDGGSLEFGRSIAAGVPGLQVRGLFC